MNASIKLSLSRYLKNVRASDLVIWLVLLITLSLSSVISYANVSSTSVQPELAEKPSSVRTFGAAAQHGLKSFLLEPVRSPITSLKRLSFYAFHGANDLVSSSYNDYLRKPLLQSRRPSERAQMESKGLDYQSLASTMGLRPSSGTVNVLIDGERYYSRLKQAIESANESVEIRTYIFDNDDVALEIADLLKRRSQEIEVRIMMDGLGTLISSSVKSHTLPEKHIEPDSIVEYLKRNSKIKTRFLSNPWLTGDHTKSVIIDNQIAFIGGMNIGREYRYDWHDMMVELTGPIVSDIGNEFDRAWRHASLGDLAFLFPAKTRVAPKSVGELKPLHLLHTRPEQPQIYQTQIAAIRRAQNYIFLQNAYFSDDLVVAELIRAKQRGVDVRVILPNKGDNAAMNRSNVLAANSLLSNGIRVYLYPRMTHIKASIFDGWAHIGSANFDKLSFKVNRELNISTADPEVVETLLADLFERDFADSQELDHILPTHPVDHIVEMVADLAF